MKTYQRPARIASDHVSTDYTESHPAYAIIGASRLQSTGHQLFGSDFRHHGFIRVRIAHAVLDRGLSHDWTHGRDQIVEVDLSEAQWATFLSTLNMGDGVPCTLNWTAADGDVPGIAPDTQRLVQHRQEIDDTLQDALQAIRELRDGATSKKQRDLADKAIRELTANLPFVAESFDQHAEDTIEHAKVEIDAWLTGAVMRTGLQALGGTPMLELTEGAPEDDQ